MTEQGIRIRRYDEYMNYQPMVNFTTKDSGQRDQFKTGAQRDTQDSKPRYDLIPPLMLHRLADLYARGAMKYDDDNWQKGIPLKRVYASLFRHLMQWAEGDTSEDHLSAVIWNATTLMWTEQAIIQGLLPPELADFGFLKDQISSILKKRDESGDDEHGDRTET